MLAIAVGKSQQCHVSHAVHILINDELMCSVLFHVRKRKNISGAHVFLWSTISTDDGCVHVRSEQQQFLAVKLR
jgi:hypothetical protein